jgi:acyl-CoA thioesterase YciA
MNSNKEPHGELAIRTLAMPANTNPNGDIFGGWVVSHMDLAGLSAAQKFTNVSRVVTVAIDKMTFLHPVRVGDYICCYADIIKTGRTSITMKIETWAVSPQDKERRQVTEGVFTFVSVDEDGRPKPIEHHK